MTTESATAVPLSQSLPSPDIIALVQAGKQALEAGDLDKALQDFEGVVANFPDRPEGYNNLGALYTALGRFEQAATCFGKVLQLLPDNNNVRYNRGIVRIRLREYTAAIADFEAVLADEPHDADCWNNLGVAVFLQQDFAAARPHFERALELAPDFPNALLNLSDAELALGNRPAAIEVCEDYLEKFSAAEVRGKLLDLLEAEARDLLVRAGKVAEDLLNQDTQASEMSQRLARIQAAAATLSGHPVTV